MPGKRETQAAIARQAASKSREIGEIRPIANVARRRECVDDLWQFCRTYNPDAFYLDPADYHLDELKRIEEATLLGALYAMADPRGDGKTTRTRMAALWAVANAHIDYAFIIGANSDKGQDAINSLKLWIRYLPLFVADYPEISQAVEALAGIANRASGQTCQGESTLIEWSQDRLILPTVPPPKNWPKKWKLRGDGMVPTSGAIIASSGLTGEGIRGSVITTSTGEMKRPALVLLDDPQTDESAHSKTQNATRKKLISSAILGLAGPGEKIAAVMPCTVIARGDAIDEILDRSKHPLWRGTRRGILKSMPADIKAWQPYFDVYDECALLEPPDFTRANAYYVEHQAVLEADAEAAWPARKEAADVSAIQHAMHLYHRDVHAFWSEYMNAPLDDETGPVSRKLDADAIRSRLSGIPRLIVPREATRLTAFIDCGGEVLWYAVVALDERWSGSVIDYGWWPGQPKEYFAKSNPPRPLSDVYPGRDDGQRLYAALLDLTNTILGRRYTRHGTDESLTIERCLVDEGWNDKTVYQFCRESTYSAILLPSKGHVPKRSSETPMRGWKAREGERAAKPGQPAWRVGPVSTGKGRHALIETNEWKSFAADRLMTPPGSAGCVRLFGEPGDASVNHAMVADHCTAEYSVPVVEAGRKFDRWQMKPAKEDNDLFDCIVGALAAAGMGGLEWNASGSPSRIEEAKPLRYADVRGGQPTPAILNPSPMPQGGQKVPLKYSEQRKRLGRT